MHEDNSNFIKMNKNLIDKIKTDRQKKKNILCKKKTNYLNKLNNSYRMTYQNNLNETKKLKSELVKLEQMEEEYLQNVKYTQEFLQKNNVGYTPIKSSEKFKSYINRDKTENKCNILKRKSNSMDKRNILNDKNRNKNYKISSVSKI